jgi:hypothetical protein
MSDGGDEFNGMWEEMDFDEFMRRHSSRRFDIPLTITEWLNRELPPPDRLMGEWMTTTSRILLNADTGLGKTNLCMAIAGAMAAAQDFLHWRARRQARVLYIDGEMSRRLYKCRIEDVARRLGCHPDNLIFWSSEDIDGFPPLNTPEGIAVLNNMLDQLGEVDFIFFDNVMALIQGDQKDELGWTQVLPLINSLTKRGIGQLWVHHTGHNATRGYGTKTREWRMDTVIHLTAVEHTDADICFQFEFRKARERTPESRADYQDVTIALVGDKWQGTVAAINRDKPSPQEVGVLKGFDDLVNDGKAVQRADGQWAVKHDDWERECLRRYFVKNKDAFRACRSRLASKNIIECDGEWSWRT